MRTAYRQQLDEFAHDLIILCDVTKDCITKATDALMRTSLASAEAALSNADQLEEVRLRCESQAVGLLALETPVARDLRQVVSSIYIVEDFTRMGALAIHIANSVRRRYPDPVVPDDMQGFIREMARLVSSMTDSIRQILIDPNPDVALEMTANDDAVDDLHQHIMRVLTSRPWPYSTRSAVDVALLSRFYERYADHTVNVAARIIYLATGLQPEEYIRKREQKQIEADVEKRWAELERQFRNSNKDREI
ncbi:phosphate signaling complex protein PhoU [Corynebacterium callunae]|uniref:phosphate signaling complex protein PhoU n=1 Tax=Corynebacterium callunae TaxID=1721 RepID=UPI001FFE7011|nr:phosphate signaling complex protein PhoU [Corynebacterium callunae]MCK2201251.1 phosphate signaling complex protein PhoU [Corynebacterium callunae]